MSHIPKPIAPPASVELFKEELDKNVATLYDNLELLDEGDYKFAESLCKWYMDKEFLTAQQIQHATNFWLIVNERKED